MATCAGLPLLKEHWLPHSLPHILQKGKLSKYYKREAGDENKACLIPWKTSVTKSFQMTPLKGTTTKSKWQRAFMPYLSCSKGSARKMFFLLFCTHGVVILVRLQSTFFSDCNCLVIWGNNGFNKVCSPTQYQEELQPVECYTIVLADNWLEISHIYYPVMFFFVCFFSVRLNLYWHLLNCYWLVLRNFNNPQSITSLSVWVWGVCLDLVQRFWHILRYMVNLHSSKGHLNRHCLVE